MAGCHYSAGSASGGSHAGARISGSLLDDVIRVFQGYPGAP